ncbi:MAG: acyltransferase family protein [Mucilaginibacter sp.]
MIDTKEVKQFRFDINALRAIAITGVLFFHYKISGFGGGFSGVDVFFVISGYLMTKIISTGLDKNTFTFLGFYEKRLKRIVPALLFLILVLTVACFFFYFPKHYKLNEKNAAASLVFVSNFLYWKTTNYFFNASDDNILLHTWSLSVEWQFYMIYPLILIVFNKVFKKGLTYITGLGIITLLIFFGSILYTKADPTASFYLLPSRCWEMLFGGIAFFGEGLVKDFKYRKYLALLGYGLIAFCFLYLRSKMDWPGPMTMLPVFATFLIIVANYNSFKVLQWGVVQFVGKISYSLYLWHWPIFVIALYCGVEMHTPFKIILTVLAVILGYISYKYVESRQLTTKQILISGSLLTIIAGCLSVYNSNSLLFKPQSIIVSDYDNQEQKKKDNQFGDCFMSRNDAKADGYNKALCLTIDSTRKNILLIGDSHAAQYSSTFKQIFGKKNINLLEATASGCTPIVKKNGEAGCSALMHYIYTEYVPRNHEKIDGVMISANWVKGKKERDQLAEDLETTIDIFKKYNIPVVIIGQNETYKMTYPFIAAKQIEYDVNLTSKYSNKEALEMDEFLKTKFKPYYVEVYTKGAAPKVSPENIPYMGDRNHFTKYGADMASVKILSSPVGKAFFEAIEK